MADLVSYQSLTVSAASYPITDGPKATPKKWPVVVRASSFIAPVSRSAHTRRTGKENQCKHDVSSCATQ